MYQTDCGIFCIVSVFNCSSDGENIQACSVGGGEMTAVPSVEEIAAFTMWSPPFETGP